MSEDRPAGTPLLLLANLDADDEHARAARGAAGGPELSAPARDITAAAGALLAAALRPGDALWTLDGVSPARLAEVLRPPGLVHIGGPLDALPHALAGRTAPGAVAAWGETPRVARIRAALEASGARPAAEDTSDGLAGRVLALAPGPPDAAARVSDRRFGAELARDQGDDAPPSRTVRSVDELRAALGGPEGAAAISGHWVAKASWSAAGRERAFGDGTAPQEKTLAALRRLLERHGELVLEPWLPREADFGACALVRPEGIAVIGTHALRSDARGSFQGVDLVAGSPRAPGLRAHEAERLEGALRSAADAARSAGWTGPLGIDAFRWSDTDGRPRFRALCELDARWTFGLVVRVLADRLLRTGQVSNGARVRLRIGPHAADVEAPAQGHRIVLVAPEPGGGVTVVLDVAGPAKGSGS